LNSNILLMNNLASSQFIHRSYPPHRQPLRAVWRESLRD
jgi:hypothetical protein